MKKTALICLIFISIGCSQNKNSSPSESSPKSLLESTQAPQSMNSDVRKQTQSGPKKIDHASAGVENATPAAIEFHNNLITNLSDREVKNQAVTLTSGFQAIAEVMPGKVKQISISANTICELGESVSCRGSNWNGLLLVPIDLKNPTQISAEGDYGCAITDVGVRCWGNQQSTKVPRDLKNPFDITTYYGSVATCAATDEGIRCWSLYFEPKIPSLNNPRSVRLVSKLHACATTDDGIICFNLRSGEASKSLPGTDRSNARTIRNLAGSEDSFCAIVDESIKCWDLNLDLRFQKVVEESWGSDIQKPLQLSVSTSRLCAVTKADKIECRVIKHSSYPPRDGTRIPAPNLSNISQVEIFGDDDLTCAVADGKTHCWEYQLIEDDPRYVSCEGSYFLGREQVKAVVGSICKNKQQSLFERTLVNGELGFRDLQTNLIWLEGMSESLTWQQMMDYCSTKEQLVPTREDFERSLESGALKLSLFQNGTRDLWTSSDGIWQQDQNKFLDLTGWKPTHPSRKMSVKCVLKNLTL